MSDMLLVSSQPGQEAGLGILDVLTGTVNPSARMPLTVYPREYLNKSLPISNFDVSKGVGRTYRYLKGIVPFYRFGYGLSYTTFTYSNLSLSYANDSVAVAFEVKNTGNVAGFEVAQVYVSLPSTADIVVPLASLCAFKKLMLVPGQSATLALDCGGDALTFVSDDGSRAHAVGIATVHVGAVSPPCNLSAQVELS